MSGPPRPETLPLRALQVVRERGLWESGHHITIAVSGGCDSVVLAHVLAKTSAAHGGRLRLVSFDHGLRAESAAEVDTVGALAARLGLPFKPVSLHLQRGPGLMVRARNARRASLAGMAADRVATGHHADDQAETVLQRLLRGSGSRGLAAMRPRAGPFVRPLLFERRSTLEAYARHCGLKWVEDPSNAGSERGRIRQLMPQLDALRGGAVPAMARSARLLAEDDALLESLADAAWTRCCFDGGLNLALLRAEPRPLAVRLVLRLAAPSGQPARADRAEAVLLQTFSGQGNVQVGAGWRLECRSGGVYLAAPG